MSTEETKESSAPEVEDDVVDTAELVDDAAEEELTTDEAAAEDDSPEAQIAALQREVSDLKDRNLRLRADLDNLRKRAVRDQSDARAMSKITTIETFLPVFDHFCMALEMIKGADNVEMIKQGMVMIGTEFERGFEGLGVERLKAVGEKFDPNLHEAFATEASDEIPADHVVREFKGGYRLGDRLLRAASVVVSTGPASEETSEEEAGEA